MSCLLSAPILCLVLSLCVFVWACAGRGFQSTCSPPNHLRNIPQLAPQSSCSTYTWFIQRSRYATAQLHSNLTVSYLDSGQPSSACLLWHVQLFCQNSISRITYHIHDVWQEPRTLLTFHSDHLLRQGYFILHQLSKIVCNVARQATLFRSCVPTTLLSEISFLLPKEASGRTSSLIIFIVHVEALVFDFGGQAELKINHQRPAPCHHKLIAY